MTQKKEVDTKVEKDQKIEEPTAFSENYMMLNFTGYEGILDAIEKKAFDEMREPAMQAMWMLKQGLSKTE